jgi:nicotinamide mononucleotide transporter
MSPFEIAANAITTLAIFLAARNSVHTWWLGIIGSLIFIVVFYQAKLYADASLQFFFIVTSLIGWRLWLSRHSAPEVKIQRTNVRTLLWMSLAAVLVTAVYGSLLHYFTDAYAPYVDSAVLGFSVMAQLLLMQRRIENWWVWIIVNTLSVPLFASRELYLTSGLYAIYWFNAWYGMWHWSRQMRGTPDKIVSNASA